VKRACIINNIVLQLKTVLSAVFVTHRQLVLTLNSAESDPHG